MSRTLIAVLLCALLISVPANADSPENLQIKLEKLGILMGCVRQLDMLFDHKEKVKYYIEQFLQGNYKVFH